MANAQPVESPIPINGFNMGGLSDSKWSGVKNSLFKFVGFDPHTSPGVLRVAQKLTKNSGTTVTEFCKARVASTNGYTYWGSSSSGKIWQRDPAGVWTLVYTLAAGSGESKILEMREYQGYIYIATQLRLHRILAANAIGATSWNLNIALNWANFLVGDDLYHPMKDPVDVLYIGDGHVVAQVDGNTFSNNALDIATPLRIKCLGKMGTDLLIGTWVTNNITKTAILRWNTWSVSFSTSDEIDEVGINAFLEADNFVYLSAGLAGNLYQYDGTVLDLYRRIPGDYSPTLQATVHPQAIGNFGGQILFGVSNVTGNPCDQGVYRIGRNSRNYPYIMDFPYPISERSSGNFVLSGIEIGAILVVGSDIFVSWKNGATFGVDMLDYSNKLNGAYLESRVMTVRRDIFANYSKFLVAYSSFPASTDIAIAYSKNYGSYINTTEKNDTERNTLYAEAEGVEATTLQMKVTATTSGNNAPEIESCLVYIR